MSQQCPRCRRTLDVAGAPLSFCGYCGAALKGTTAEMDPDATLAPLAGSDPLNSPDRVGEYRLGRCLGRGGMGVVHEGEHEATGRQVAVKLIDVSATPEALTRFRREGKLAASVTHPRCVFVLARWSPLHRHGTDAWQDP
jgi:serine/threonine protein kinase